MRALPFVLVLVCLAGCTQNQASETTELTTLTPEQALEIAVNSDCVNEGSFTGESSYNGVTNTWWFQLSVEGYENCNPACVVSEQTGLAEINWRCTGLIEP
jgi:hypothetical protein